MRPGSPTSARSFRSETLSELNTQLEPELLRGVSTCEVLSGWGRHWQTPDSGMFNVDPNNYGLSKPTTSLDAFLSHDWASSGVLKFLSLLIIYNSGAAFVACLLTSVAVGILRGFSVIPDEAWTVSAGHAAFFLVLAFWQRLRCLMRRPAIVFLDKLCVAQHDEELKQKGIKGIAAFLLSSRQLTVLLTPRYFARLWCTFEIATFMKDPERRKHIQFMPLKTTVLLILASGCWFALAIGWNIFKGFYSDGNLSYGDGSGGLALTGLMLLLSSAILPFAFYVGMGAVADLEENSAQLANFKVKDAECFCCSNNHRHPNTGARLPCDRRLVYNTLKQWYGDADGGDGDYLERFSRLVREDLAPMISLLVGGVVLPFSYTVYMVCVSSVPYLADHISQCIAAGRSGVTGLALVALSLRHVADWGIVPLAALLAQRVVLPLWKAGLRLPWNRWCTAVALGLVVFAFVCVIWIPVPVALDKTSDDDLLPVAIFLAWFLLTVVLFSPTCSEPGLRRWVPEHDQLAPGPAKVVAEDRAAGKTEETFQV